MPGCTATKSPPSSSTPSSRLSESLLDTDQQAAITRLVEYDHTLLDARMGAGKTVIAATAMMELGMRFLVVAPKAVCESAWVEEWTRWSHLDVAVAWALGGVRERTAAVEAGCQVTVINFENLAWLRGLVGAQPRWEGLLVDEGTKMSQAGSERFKAIRSWLPRFQWTCVMSGTPVAEGLDRLYAQMLLVDEKVLGRSQERFRTRWCEPVDYERHSWRVRDEMVAPLLERVRPWVHSVPDYRGSLPELVVDVEWVDLPEEAMDQYRQLARDSVLGDVEAVNEAVLVGHLQRFASGFLYGTAGVERFHDAKRDALGRALASTAEATLVVYQWAEDRDWLEEMGVPVYHAGLRDAWNAGSIGIMAVHPRACGHGLNLQAGRRMVMLGPMWSRDQHDQVIARLWRRGQRERVEVTILAARDTVDWAVLARLEDKAAWGKAWDEHVRSVTE